MLVKLFFDIIMHKMTHYQCTWYFGTLVRCDDNKHANEEMVVISLSEVQDTLLRTLKTTTLC